MEKPWTRASRGHALKTACAGSDIDVAPYMLRHSFACRAVLAGWPKRVLSKWMGHSIELVTTGYFKELGMDDFQVPPALPSTSAKAAQ